MSDRDLKTELASMAVLLSNARRERDEAIAERDQALVDRDAVVRSVPGCVTLREGDGLLLMPADGAEAAESLLRLGDLLRSHAGVDIVIVENAWTERLSDAGRRMAALRRFIETAAPHDRLGIVTDALKAALDGETSRLSDVDPDVRAASADLRNAMLGIGGDNDCDGVSDEPPLVTVTVAGGAMTDESRKAIEDFLASETKQGMVVLDGDVTATVEVQLAKTYTPRVGEIILTTATKMVEMANDVGGSVSATFNGIALTAFPSDNAAASAEAIVAKYEGCCERNAESWREPPERKRLAAEADARRAELQSKADRLLSDLRSLDFSDVGAVIDWVEAFQPASDHIDVNFDVGDIIGTFEANGYEPGVNCDEAFDDTSEDIEARWLIGQALDCLREVGAVHGSFSHFANEWRRKHRP